MTLPDYSVWMTMTDAGFLAKRNNNLKLLDKAIKVQSEEDIREALLAYLAGGDPDYQARNRTGAIDRLKDTVGLNDRDDFGITVFDIPHVDAPPNPFQFAPAVVRPPVPQSAARQKFTFIKNNLQRAVEKETQLKTARLARSSKIYETINSMNGDMGELSTAIQFKLVNNSAAYGEGMKLGINLFTKFHDRANADISFNLTIFKGVCSLLESLPFPLSMMGKVGGAIAGQLHVNSIPPATSELTIPSPVGIVARIKKTGADTFDRITDVNPVPIGRLSNHAIMIDNFSENLHNYAKSIKTAFDQERRCIVDHPARELYVKEYLSKVHDISSTTRMDTLADMAILEINRMGQEIKQQFAPLANVPQVLPTDVQFLIAIRLLADYAKGLTGDQTIHNMKPAELGALTINQNFIDFLSSKEIDLVQERPSSNTSDNIYASGKIPWSNRRYDVIAVMLFLEWYQENINPFLLLRPGVTLAGIKAYMATYIRKLGLAMKRYIDTDTGLRTKTVTSVTAVHGGSRMAMTGVESPESIARRLHG